MSTFKERDNIQNCLFELTRIANAFAITGNNLVAEEIHYNCSAIDLSLEEILKNERKRLDDQVQNSLNASYGILGKLIDADIKASKGE